MFVKPRKKILTTKQMGSSKQMDGTVRKYSQVDRCKTRLNFVYWLCRLHNTKTDFLI